MISIVNELMTKIVGLSTDEKPVAYNGSIYYEMDTGDVYFYDGENAEWIKAGGGNAQAIVGTAIIGTAIVG